MWSVMYIKSGGFCVEGLGYWLKFEENLEVKRRWLVRIAHVGREITFTRW